MSIPRVIPTSVAVGLVLVLAALLLRSLTEGRRATEASARADSLATELANRDLHALGFATALSTAREGWLEELAGRDSTIAALERSLAAARAHVVARAELVAQAAGTVEAPPATSTPDSVTAPLDDGILRGRVAYFPAAPLFRLDYTATIAAELYAATTADRRLLVAVRPLQADPRVRLEIPTLEYALPEPERRGWPWRCAGTAAGSGALVAAVPDWWSALSGIVATAVACR